MIIYLHFPRNIERQSKDTRKKQSQSRKANPKTKLFRFHWRHGLSRELLNCWTRCPLTSPRVPQYQFKSQLCQI